MNIRMKLILGVLLVIVITISFSTIGISYLVRKQNDENSRNLVVRSVHQTCTILEKLRKSSLQRVADVAADPSNTINMRYLMEIKGRKNIGAYKFILERPKEDLAMSLVKLAREGDFDGFYVFDGAGDLIIYVARTEEMIETALLTFNEEGEEVVKYRQLEHGSGSNLPWKEKPFADSLMAYFDHPLSEKPGTWFGRIQGSYALLGVAPFVHKMAEYDSDVDFHVDRSGQRVGCILFRKDLGRDFVDQIHQETQMEINVFAGTRLASGSLVDFDRLPEDCMAHEGSQQAEGPGREVRVRIYTRSGQEYYQSIVPLYGEEGMTGAIALSLSREDTLRKTREMIFLFFTIMVICIFGAVPVSVHMAEKISARIKAVLAALKEINGGNLDVRVEVASTDELGGLALAFNQMTADLQHHLEVIRQSEEKYRNLFDFAPDGVFITTPEGRILSFNDTLMKIFNYDDREAFSKLSSLDLYQAPDRSRPALIERLKEEGRLESQVVAFKDKEGKPFTGSLSLRLIQYAGETCIQAMMRDVSRIMEMEKALRDYSANLERMVEEKTEKLSTANKQLLRAYNDAEKIIEELELTKYALEHSNEELASANKNLNETQEQLALSAHQAGMAEVAVSVLHNIGNTTNSVNVRAYGLEGSLNRDRRNIESLEKILGLLETEGCNSDGVQRDDERWAKLLKYFKTVIGALRETRERLRDDLEFIRKGLDHIMEIIGLQQKYAGVRGHETRVSVNDLLKDSLEMLMDSIKKRGILLECDFTDVPDIVINKNKMMQVFINIIKNAYEAIDAAPLENEHEIRLATSLDDKDPRYVRIVISDTGVGLDAEAREKVFRFNFSTKGRGTGFGLHDAANYIHAQDGFIDIVSEGPGKGARLDIKLPVRKEGERQ